MTTELSRAAGPAVTGHAADPGEAVIRACRRARDLLREALEHGDIGEIAEIRSQAEAVRVYTTQKQLGKDAQLAAAEIVRRADRGLARAVRQGQEDGRVKRRGDGRRNAGHPGGTDTTTMMSSGDYLGHGQARADVYAMTDGVSDEEFEDALAQAKEEENLSRANVVRAIRQRRVPPGRDDSGRVPAPGDRSSAAAARRAALIGRWAGEGSTSRQIAGLLGIRDDAVRRIAREQAIRIRADEVAGRTRRTDSNRIVRETASALEGLAMGAGLVDPAELDKTQVPGWAASITASLRALNQLARTLKQETADD